MSQTQEYKGALPQSTIHVEVPEGPQLNIQENKNISITSNTETEVTPDNGYDALKKVTVTTNVLPTLYNTAITNLNFQDYVSNYTAIYLGKLRNYIQNYQNYYGVNTNIDLVLPISNILSVVNETLTNKRITSPGTYTVSNWLSDTDQYKGISAASTIVVDTPTYDITQISNYSITSEGLQTIPIPTGYDAVDSISVNVEIQPLKYRYIMYAYDSVHDVTTFTFTSTNVTLTTNAGVGRLVIRKPSSGNTYYNIGIYYNTSSNQRNLSIPANSYYSAPLIVNSGNSGLTLAKDNYFSYVYYNTPLYLNSNNVSNTGPSIYLDTKLLPDIDNFLS